MTSLEEHQPWEDINKSMEQFIKRRGVGVQIEFTADPDLYSQSSDADEETHCIVRKSPRESSPPRRWPGEKVTTIIYIHNKLNIYTYSI